MPVENEANAISAEIIRLLQKERERKKLSKYALSQLSGVSQQTLGNVERGLKSPTFETMWRMAAALDIDLSQLIDEATQSVRKRKPR